MVGRALITRGDTMARPRTPPPVLFVGLAEPEYCGPHAGRYTHRPNQDLANNRSVCRGSTAVRSPRLADGLAFCEPVAAQGFNDQFPWR